MNNENWGKEEEPEVLSENVIYVALAVDIVYLMIFLYLVKIILFKGSRVIDELLCVIC